MQAHHYIFQRYIYIALSLSNITFISLLSDFYKTIHESDM